MVKCRKITFKIRDKKETEGASSGSGTVVDDQDGQEVGSERYDWRLHRQWDGRSSVPSHPEEVHSFLISPIVLLKWTFFSIKPLVFYAWL